MMRQHIIINEKTHKVINEVVREDHVHIAVKDHRDVHILPLWFYAGETRCGLNQHGNIYSIPAEG